MYEQITMQEEKSFKNETEYGRIYLNYGQTKTIIEKIFGVQNEKDA